MGTNVLLGLDPKRISEVPALISARKERETHIPPLWDGKASERIVAVLAGAPAGRVQGLGQALG